MSGMTVGELGPPRPSSKLLPGDILFIGYDITGLTIEPDGLAKYKMSMEVKDADGKSIFKQDPRELNDFVPLRGNSIPARAFVTIGLDQDPGNYTCKVTVEDPKTKAKDTLTTKFEVTKREYGIVAVYTTLRPEGGNLRPDHRRPSARPSSSTSASRPSSAIRRPSNRTSTSSFRFSTRRATARSASRASMTRTTSRPSRWTKRKARSTMHFPLFMSRPGKFTAKITATDKVANKTATYELPVTILPAN